MFLHLSLSVFTWFGTESRFGAGRPHRWRTTFISSDVNPDHQLAEIQTVFCIFYNLEIFLLASYLLLPTSRKVVGLLSDLGKLLSSFICDPWEVQKDFPQLLALCIPYLISPPLSTQFTTWHEGHIYLQHKSWSWNLHDLRLSEAAQWEIKVFLEAILIPSWIAHRTT